MPDEQPVTAQNSSPDESVLPAEVVMAAVPKEAAEYNESMIRVLNDVEHVRTRPGMYIGGYNTRGLHHLVYEIVDNSIDEA
ncbi:MAG TPA: hypothetical protein VIL86_05970, partial [Tepidisphaeraceae bacterium]